MTDQESYEKLIELIDKLGGILNFSSDDNDDDYFSLPTIPLFPLFSWWTFPTNTKRLSIRVAATSNDYKIRFVDEAANEEIDFDEFIFLLNEKQREVVLYNLDLFI